MTCQAGDACHIQRSIPRAPKFTNHGQNLFSVGRAASYRDDAHLPEKNVGVHLVRVLF